MSGVRTSIKVGVATVSVLEDTDCNTGNIRGEELSDILTAFMGSNSYLLISGGNFLL